MRSDVPEPLLAPTFEWHPQGAELRAWYSAWIVNTWPKILKQLQQGTWNPSTST